VSHKLVSHNADLSRLAEKGYAISFSNGHLIVRDIPYLDVFGNLKVGAFVTTLQHIDSLRVQQTDHQVYFAGGVPHEIDGTPIRNLGGGPTTLHLDPEAADVVVERSFSNKPLPEGRFPDFFEKIESYTAIVSGPAMARYQTSPLTYRAQLGDFNTGVFSFQDTMTSRSRIGELSARLEPDVVAIIGLGGSGAYVLDHMVKTPVREIRAFDFDFFHVHNAFRSPGRLQPDELGRLKVDVYRDRYASFRSALSFYAKAIDSTSAPDLAGVTFAFVCVDKGPAREEIFKLLMALGIPFIDTGMGLDKVSGAIGGLIRTTLYPVDDAANAIGKGYAPFADGPDHEYRNNIQISDLNASAASLAVIRYKQFRGFYASEVSSPNLLLEIEDLSTVAS
jgi:hypothetical protein